MKKIILATILIFTTTLCLANEARLSWNLYVEIPENFNHIPEQGIDSKIGKILNDDESIIIRYDLGRLAGLYADPKEANNYKIFEEGEIDQTKYYYAVDKQDNLYVTFPDYGLNFIYKLKSNEDYRNILNLILTFKLKLKLNNL